MKLRFKGMITAGTLALVLLMGTAAIDRAKAQEAKAAAAKGITAGEYYKNVTTSTLKGVTPSDFLGAMGVLSAALGYDCADCHPGAGSDNADFVTDANPIKKRARKMIEMVAAINKDN